MTEKDKEETEKIYEELYIESLVYGFGLVHYSPLTGFTVLKPKDAIDALEILKKASEK
jgi:hypothetical protein